MGQRLVIVSSPLGGCVSFTPFPVEFSRFCTVLCLRVGFSFSSGSVGVAVGSSGAIPRGNFWGSHVG